MNLREIEILIDKRQYDDALEECQKVAETMPELTHEIIRLKSGIYAKQGFYKEAVENGLLVINAGKANLGWYDATAFWALFDGQLEKSLELYLTALKMGEELNDSWFRSNELFLIAYIYYKLGNYESAKFYLGKLDIKDKESSFLIPIPDEGILGVCYVEQLHERLG